MGCGRLGGLVRHLLHGLPVAGHQGGRLTVVLFLGATKLRLLLHCELLLEGGTSPEGLGGCCFELGLALVLRLLRLFLRLRADLLHAGQVGLLLGGQGRGELPHLLLVEGLHLSGLLQP